MTTSTEILAQDLFLQQSIQYGDQYESYEEDDNISTFNDLSVYKLKDWKNSLLQKYKLNPIQTKSLNEFFIALNYVLRTINPDKLAIQDDLIEEIDILFWRESTQGISQLIFDELGQIVYLYNGNDGTKQKGIFEANEIDMQKLLLRFLSK